MVKLSVIIVNFNSGDYLSHCLESLVTVKDEADLEIYVVDNASSDDSLKLAQKNFKGVNYIAAGSNLGFAKANNIALKKVTTEYILILNPDTEVKKGVLEKMLKFMEENELVGASTCEIMLSTGKVDLTAHRGFPTPLASLLYFLGNDSFYHLTGSPMDKSHEVDAISGAFFLTRKSVLDKVGLFDEDFFLYGEDLDLCFRIKQAGFKVMYVPDVSIIHHKGVSSGLKKHSQDVTTADLETKRRSLDAFYSAMSVFYIKHYSANHLFLMNWLINLGIHIKWWLAKRRMTV